MRSLDQAAMLEAGATALLAAGNGCFFAAEARRAKRPRRKAAAGTLALVNFALAAEALLYLSLLPGGAPAASAALLVNTLALVAVAAMSALVLRSREAGR